jgi:hypothetical protein
MPDPLLVALNWALVVILAQARIIRLLLERR